jgi:tRNA/tmRNA/rRNA uracil-C5-methylase (TrmA/RlmC/RlmD family)
MADVVRPATSHRRRPAGGGLLAPGLSVTGPDASRTDVSRPGAADSGTARGASFQVGQTVEVTTQDVAQGGWCVARPEGLPVVFVRHALPGERVVVKVTEVTSRFARAEAVQVVQASADRVPAPCGNARPGGCGGCDWQHATLPAQRALKAKVIGQQLKRLAGIDREVTVEPLPGDGPSDDPDEITARGGTPGLGWRTRVQFAVGADGIAGLRAHRSHEVIDIGDCPLAHPAIRELDIPGHDWTGAATVEVAAGGADSIENVAVIVTEGGGHPGRGGRGRGGRRGGETVRRTLAEGRPYLAERAAGRIWQVSADGFWQVHPAAAGALCEAVLAALDPKPGDTVLDLYCGAGLFAGVLAPRTGPSGAVTGIESDPAAVKDARLNLGDYPWAAIHESDVARAVGDGTLPRARLVVADPPRAGLAREIIDHLVGDSGAERFAYVSCDPATLARDLALLLAGGWHLETLRAFDAFPMTHHVECVALLSAGEGVRSADALTTPAIRL